MAAISSMATRLVGSAMASVRPLPTRPSGRTSYLRAMCCGTIASVAGSIAWSSIVTDGRPCSLDRMSTSWSSLTSPFRASTLPSRSFERRCSRRASCSCCCEMNPSATSSSPSRPRRRASRGRPPGACSARATAAAISGGSAGTTIVPRPDAADGNGLRRRLGSGPGRRWHRSERRWSRPRRSRRARGSRRRRRSGRTRRGRTHGRRGRHRDRPRWRWRRQPAPPGRPAAARRWPTTSARGSA